MQLFLLFMHSFRMQRVKVSVLASLKVLLFKFQRVQPSSPLPAISTALFSILISSFHRVRVLVMFVKALLFHF